MGDPYAVVIEVQGGAGPYAFEHTFDVPGLRVDDGGRILGVPTEAGLYSVTLQVRGADGGAGARTLPLTILAAGAAPVVEAPCEQPLAVSSAGPVASVRARFGAEEESSSCGLSAAAQLFLSVDLEEATTVEVELFSERPGAAAVRRVNSTCDSLGSATCAEALSTTLPAGRTLFLVEGRSGDEVLVLFRFIRGGSNPTCTTPVTLEFEDGVVEFEVLPTEEEGVVLPFCGGDSPVQVHTFNLSEPADLVVDSTVYSVIIGVGGEDCFEGSETCTLTEARSRITNLAAGLHHLYARSYQDERAMVRLSLAPPTPRPENDRCVDALSLDLSTGEAQADLRFWSATPDQLEVCYEDYHLYYRFDLEETSGVRIQSGDRAEATLLRVPLDASGRPDCANGAAIETCEEEICLGDLGPGTYVLAVSGDIHYEPQTLSVVREAPRTAPVGDTCAEAPVVTLNAPGTTTIPLMLQGSTATHPEATCGGSVGEVWRAVTLPPGRWRLRFQQSAVVFGPECGDALTTGCDWRQNVVLDGGEYRLAIPEPDSGPWCNPPGTPDLEFEVDITAAGPAPAGDTCDDVPALVLNPGTSVLVRAELEDAADDAHTLSCSGRPADDRPDGEVFRRLELPSPARLRVETLTASAYPDIALTTACDAVVGLVCGGSWLDTNTPIPAGTYWLRMEGDEYIEALVTAL